MGTRLAMLIVSDDAPISSVDQLRLPNDRDAASALAKRIFPRRDRVPLDDRDLLNAGWPNVDQLFVGVFGSISIICSPELYKFLPGQVHAKFLREGRGRVAQHFVIRSMNDMFVYGQWRESELVRSLSVNPVAGIYSNVGSMLEVEAPFWAGAHAQDDYPLPFHPLDLANRMLTVLTGIEGELTDPVAGSVSPDEIVLMGFDVGTRD